MRNADQWKPSKFVYKRGKLRASRNSKEVGISSRLIADHIAALYEQYIPQHCRGRLIDLGCGKVPLYATYQAYVTEAVCVDWPQSLHGNTYVDVGCDLTQPLPFEDGRFDTVILSDVLEHLPQPELMWGEMRRILTDGGKVLMNVPFYYWLHEQPHDYYRYTEFALRRFAEPEFQVVLLTQLGGAPEVLADITAKNVMPVRLVGSATAATIQWLAWRFGQTRLGRRLSERTSATFPLGYFMVAEKVASGSIG